MAEKILLGGWQYLNEKLEVLHTTSIPADMDAAIDYAKNMDVWYMERAHFIARREPDEGNYKLTPWKFDPRVDKFVPIEEALK